MNFTIIIPHKNSSSLLPRLLESIPKREDLEILVVDDNSSCAELESLHFLMDKYNFLLLTNNGNRGAGASRNIGIRNAKGKWIVFADSDDFFMPTFNHELELTLSKESDIIFYKVSSVDSESLRPANRHLFFNDLIEKYIKYNKCDILFKYSVPWGKIYRRDFIKDNNLFFSEVIAGNDMYFSCNAGILSNKYEILPKEIYTVTLREGSIVNTVNDEFFLSRFNETLIVNKLLVSNKLEKYQYSVLYFLLNSFKFNYRTFFFVIKGVVKNRSNLLIGLDKVFNYKKVLSDRENRK